MTDRSDQSDPTDSLDSRLRANDEGFDSYSVHFYTESVRLTSKQREHIAKYLLDISKLAFAGMVIGKFVSANPIPTWVLVIGLVFSFGSVSMAVVIDRGETHD